MLWYAETSELPILPCRKPTDQRIYGSLHNENLAKTITVPVWHYRDGQRVE